MAQQTFPSMSVPVQRCFCLWSPGRYETITKSLQSQSFDVGKKFHQENWWIGSNGQVRCFRFVFWIIWVIILIPNKWIVFPDIHGNHISRLDGFESLPNLRTLNLAGNQIRIVDNLHALTSLAELNLRRNAIEKVMNLHFLEDLKRLYLSFNSIGSFKLDSKFLSIVRPTQCFKIKFMVLLPSTNFELWKLNGRIFGVFLSVLNSLNYHWTGIRCAPPSIIVKLWLPPAQNWRF